MQWNCLYFIIIIYVLSIYTWKKRLASETKLLYLGPQTRKSEKKWIEQKLGGVEDQIVPFQLDIDR